jgi:predicted SAM-dependent methyltransferase
VKINVGCGGRRYDGYIGVDAVERPGADVVADAGDLPFDDNSADEVMAIHVAEHLVPWDLPPTLKEWLRVLKPGGTLVMELPDLLKCCRNILDGVMRGGKHPDQLGMWGLFGDARDKDVWMLHRYSYTFKTLAPIVEEAGFIKVKEFQTKFHPAGRDVRDFRLEARKPA